MKAIIIGKTYKINHSRKGIFHITATGETEEWLYGVIVKGTATKLNGDVYAAKGDKITIRKSLCIINQF